MLIKFPGTLPALTFFDFPEEEWFSLRTTKFIERLNKEFMQRIKLMEIITGKMSVTPC